MTRDELAREMQRAIAFYCGSHSSMPAAEAALAAIEAAGFRIVPLKLMSEAHACMRATGWQLAPASEQVSDDGVLECAVAEIEEQFAAMVAASPIAAKEGT